MIMLDDFVAEPATTPTTTTVGPTEGMVNRGNKLRTNRVLFDYGLQFKVDGDFEEIVDGNVNGLRETITNQLSEKVQISRDDIVIGIEKGKLY